MTKYEGRETRDAKRETRSEKRETRGSIFETFVVSELVKNRFNQGERAVLHFWRDSNGNEVDVIADVGTKLMPIEIKSGQTVNRDFFTGMKRWQVLAGDQAVAPTLVYGGGGSYMHQGVKVLGWDEVGRLL